MDGARPIIAILRGLRPGFAGAAAEALCEAGIALIEAPLNQPHALAMIEEMARAVGDAAEIGAGTVLTPGQADEAASAGAQFIVSPDTNAQVIAQTKRLGLSSWPGAFTPTECFTALAAGADGLKLFPAFLMGPPGVGALRTVLPAGAPLYAVGGAGPENFAAYLMAGASGFGLGSCLFQTGWTPGQIRTAARGVVVAFDDALAAQAG